MRQLMLLGKVIQNLANETMPGKKEAYMKQLNDFIINNTEPLRSFYQSLLARKGDNDRFSGALMSDIIRENSLQNIFRLLNDASNRKHLEQHLSASGLNSTCASLRKYFAASGSESD
eukprot:TRINITY_DN8755_c0_g1_i1.p2 TRINITY_DN8755_c0_g1~~TRINITY_DN8755_c0_g1_i1.p2  ORF type:complete len:117 (+),score=21.38 TRINITY_DN8755_c0_g1_i1:265-615(+)